MKVICSLLLLAPGLSALIISCYEYFLITVKPIISLNSEYFETESFYNYVGIASVKSPESQVLELERLSEFWEQLSGIQQEIAEMKFDGYSSKKIYSALEMKPSAYYVEVNRIKKVLVEMIG